jgi:class 3 adenylate cyclase
MHRPERPRSKKNQANRLTRPCRRDHDSAVPACSNCAADLPAGARFCLNCGTAASQAPAAEERKVATVLFADLAGSTAFASSRDPEHVRDVLDRYYDAMTAEIVENGGTLEKFIGDAVVAVFGAPVAREDHAERALDAALAMQRRFADLFSADGLALRIGVNTGEVVLGRARESSSFVSGDTVNVAARLEQAAPPGEVLVGERTAAVVGAAFEFSDPMTVEAKGKAGGVPARRLVRMLAENRPRGVLSKAFVGRDDELAWLTSQFERSRAAGRPLLAVVMGDPGVGKTTLLGQFRAQLPADATFRIGRCVSFGRAATYRPLADVLRDDPDASNFLERWPMLNVTHGGPVPAELDPRIAAERLRIAWTELLSELAAQRPTVLVVEDLHWASGPLMTLLTRVLADARGPLFVLGTTRPEPVALEGAHSLELEPLSPAAVDELLRRLLGTELPSDAHALVVQQAEGNPFFLEEIIATFIDRGLLRWQDGAWVWHAAATTVDVPDSIQALLAARIDLLPADAKAALQTAAVIGRVFGEDVLRQLDVAKEIETLVRRGFVLWAGTELMFKHALTREVAYASLTKSRRAVLHASIASWLEHSTGGDDAYAATLAHHYAEAVRPDIASLAWRGRDDERERLWEAACSWLRRAADVAMRAYDIDAALGLLERAAELTPADPEIWRAMGHADALKYAGPAYTEAMLRAIELTDDRATLGALYAELAGECSIRASMWPTPPDISHFKAWVDKALEFATPGTDVQARALIARSFVDDDAEAAQAGIRIAEAVGDVTLVARGHHSLWGVRMQEADYHAAHEIASKAASLVGAIADLDAVATIHQSCVATAISVGRFDEADEHLHRMAAVAERLSAHHAIHVMGSRISLYETRDDWAAIRALQADIETAVATNSMTPCAINARLLLASAVAAAEAGLDAEVARLEAAHAALGLDGYRMWFGSLQARLAMLRGDMDQLAALLENAESWRWPVFVHCEGVRTHLDGLLRLERYEEAAHEAERHGQPGSYLEPYALRTLAVVRGDDELEQRATARLTELGLMTDTL